MFIQCKDWFSTKAVTSTLFASILMAGSVTVEAKERVVNFLNWSGQIGATTIQEFTEKTGIKVTYDTFDSNEVLEGKLMVGNSGFDVVSPSDSFLARQIQAELYLPLDKSKLPNLKNLDPILMERLTAHDPENKFAIPFVWMTTGVGYNVKKIKEIFGEDFEPDSWSFVFEPENMEKLQKCGVAFLDAPTEVFASTLKYLGKDPNSTVEKDYSSDVYNVLVKIRPYIRYFHSSQYISDLATGDICVALGWAGDFMQARNRANEAKNGIELRYFNPKEGSLLFFDTLAIPKDAKNVEEAHELLNFMMEPKSAADVTNEVFFANANEAARALVKPEILNDKTIYPAQVDMEKTFSLTVKPPKLERVITRTWTRLRTGK